MNYDLKLGLKLLLYPFYATGVNLRSRALPGHSSQNQPDLGGLSQIVPIAGTSNFRDLGGIATAHGHTLKPNLLYRSDHIDFVPTKSLLQLGVRTLVDFRSPREQKKLRKFSTIQHIRLPIFKGSEVARIRKLLLSAHRKPFDGQKVMMEAYRYFAEEAADQFADFFSILSSPENLPLVFHCTAGKDRTGFATALLLTLLGVPEKTVRQDYLATNLYRREANRILMQKGRFFVEEERLAPLLEVQPLYLEEANKAIERRYGSFADYREKALHLSDHNVQKLSNLYLNSVGGIS